MTVRLYEDCCIAVLLPDDAEPVLTLNGDDDDVDPFSGEEVGGYVVYWSNGTITWSNGMPLDDTRPLP